MNRMIDGDAVINFQFYDEENEEWTMKAMSIIDFLESHSADPIPTININQCENCQEFSCDGCEHEKGEHNGGSY